MRPDRETVVSAVVDHAVARPDVDSDRIAHVGLSLGAHLAPRAPSGEHRLAGARRRLRVPRPRRWIPQAAPAAAGGRLPGAHDVGPRRLPPPLADGYQAPTAWARAAVRAITTARARKPTAGWALRRGMMVHCARSTTPYLDALRDDTLAGRAEQIASPTWICHAGNDDIGASAPELAAYLRVPHELPELEAADGAGDHREAGARGVYHAASFGWLDALLEPRRVAGGAQPVAAAR
jgi:hypothetical protein